MRIVVAIVLVVVGVLAVVAGVLYLTQPAHDLPSFFPGYVAHATGKHPTRGTAGVVVGAVLIVVGLIVGLTGHRRDRSY